MPNSRTPRIIGRIIKITAVMLVFSVCFVLIWRMVTSRDPKSMCVLIPNDALLLAYEEDGEELLMQYQNLTTVTNGKTKDGTSNAGYFSVTQYVFIPKADQVQLVFRYNNSTLKHLAEDYGLDEIPPKDGTYFDVSLVRSIDLTPNNREDNYNDDGTTPENIKTERFLPSSFERDTTALYTYYRYVFEGVSVTEDTVGVFADVYYLEDLDYTERAYGTVCIYNDEYKWIEQKLSRADMECQRQKEWEL